MRPGPNSRRPRGRSGGGGRRNGPGRSQNFESSGPETKVRGSAQQVVEKYLNLAREATIAGNRVMAENYYQHAEHYYRIQNANNESSNNAHNNADHQASSQGGNGREQPAYQPEQPAQGDNGANGAAEATAEPVVEPPPAAVSEPAAEAAPQPATDATPEPDADAALEAAADATPERRTPRRRRPRRSDSGPAKEPTEQPG
ncbi:MAG: DUF4167 domain-containing protein [Alphaproteobacteria bacterium]